MESTCRAIVFPCLSLLGTTGGTPDSIPVSSERGGGGRGKGEGEVLSDALPLKQGNDRARN